MIVSGHNNSCLGTNMSGLIQVWVQSCLGTDQMCLGTNVSGHKHV